MALIATEAEKILRTRLGDPEKKNQTKKIVGFVTTTGKVLAMPRDLKSTRILFEGPITFSIPGVVQLPKVSNKNSNINGDLSILRAGSTMHIQVETEAALQLFLDWYTRAEITKTEVAATSDPVSKSVADLSIMIQSTIDRMCATVFATVRNANGQEQRRTIKKKECHLSDIELKNLVSVLMLEQNNQCALSGIPLGLDGAGSDENLLASLDRIDSDRHYEVGNLQVVCRFINLWKSDMDNTVFKSLLGIVKKQP